MKTALYVDDEPSLLNVVKDYLELNGDIEIDIEKSPRKALDIIRTKRYDAIICDYNMPGMTGVEVLKKIRTEDKETPFIFFSALDFDQFDGRPFPPGKQMFIHKSADFRGMCEKLAAALNNAVQE